jgi:hypothetical protein
VEFEAETDGRVRLLVSDRELLAFKGALLEADEAIRDDTAFSARVGVDRTMARRLFDEVVEARRLAAR